MRLWTETDQIFTIFLFCHTNKLCALVIHIRPITMFQRHFIACRILYTVYTIRNKISRIHEILSEFVSILKNISLRMTGENCVVCTTYVDWKRILESEKCWIRCSCMIYRSAQTRIHKWVSTRSKCEIDHRIKRTLAHDAHCTHKRSGLRTFTVKIISKVMNPKFNYRCDFQIQFQMSMSFNKNGSRLYADRIQTSRENEGMNVNLQTQ